MNHHINPTKAAIALGAFAGGWRAVWSLLVAFGWAQPIMDFMLWMHMISMPYVVKAFNPSAAVTLVVITAIMGYVAGYVFAYIWNRAHS